MKIDFPHFHASGTNYQVGFQIVVQQENYHVHILALNHFPFFIFKGRTF